MQLDQGCYGIPKLNYSEVVVHTSNGRGSTNTAIRRYTTVLTNVGSAITYADSATLGASFTINEPGLYFMSDIAGDNSTSGACYAGISKNSLNLTTGISSLTNTEKLAANWLNHSAGNPAGAQLEASCITRLSKGDIIRPHELAYDPDNVLHCMFRIIKIGN